MSGPLFAIDRTPALSCFNFKLNSSLKGPSNIDYPPLPVPEGSPPLAFKIKLPKDKNVALVCEISHCRKISFHIVR